MTASGRLIAIGDVHGCSHALDALIEAIAVEPRDRLVFLGDLIDQGPNTREVLDHIIELQARCTVVLIEGNHEEMIFMARENQRALDVWENFGGIATLNSYRFGGSIADIPQSHWALLEQGQPYFETDDFIFTHANYLADVPMSEQPGRQLRWDLFDAEDVHPHFSGKPVVVGHTEQRGGDVLDVGLAVCIDTACWRYGWLTAMELPSRQLWQASKWGLLREPGEATHREDLRKLLAPVGK